jgi:hypothetical protein
MLSARACPPFRPSALAVASLVFSWISPVAIRMTWTALPITSAGRFSPFGPLGIRVAYWLADCFAREGMMATPQADIYGKPFTKRQFVLLEIFLRPNGGTFAELSKADMGLGPKVEAHSYKTDSETLAPRVGGIAWRDPPHSGLKASRRFGIKISN